MCLKFLTFALEWSGVGILSPLLLLVSWTAVGALDAASVVSTLTRQHTVRTRLVNVTRVGVTVAHAATSDGNVSDGIKVLRTHKL